MSVSLMAMAFGLPLAATPASFPDSWRALAEADIMEMRRLIEENHPGPVDPENPAFADRMAANYRNALARAAAAKSFFDYKRAVLSYARGFRDGHLAAYFVVDSTDFPWMPAYVWPGFTVGREEDGRFRVLSSEDSVIEAGAEIVSCDGKSIDTLMRERVDPFYGNMDIPHERWTHLHRLFVIENGDDAGRLERCRFNSADRAGEVRINWRPISSQQADQLRGGAARPAKPELHRIGDIWHVVLPAFYFRTAEGEQDMRQLLNAMKQNAEAMREGIVLLDVRGNDGGNSAWGREIVRILWGDAWLNRIEQSFDWTVDWRTSSNNLEMLESALARNERNGLEDAARAIRETRDLVAEAVREGKTFARYPAPGRPITEPPPPDLFTGRAFFLTDGACASACLDFADLVTRMPNTRHIGWPTSADAVYIDNSNRRLPSGLAGFSFSMKVYRNRVRGNNEWYEPEARWPGGPVTDEALASWIASLR